MTKVVMFDTETTGFLEPRVIQLAYCETDGGWPPRWGHIVSHMYNPDKPIEWAAVATHFIENSQLVNNQSYTEAKLPECDYVVGHSIDYDWAVMGKPDVKRICTHALATMVWPKESHKLGALCYMISADQARDLVPEAHNAVVDVMLCNMVLSAILRELAALGHDIQTWEDLWVLSEQARIPTIMPFGKHKGEPMAQVPYSYLTWLMKQPDVDPYLMIALKGAMSP